MQLPSTNSIIVAVRYIIDVAAVAILIYRALILVRGTRAAAMLIGLTLLAIVYLIAKLTGLVTLDWLLGNVLSSFIIIIVILFQDEIRRALIKVGLRQAWLREKEDKVFSALDEISLAVAKLSKEKVGALIVIQNKIGLDEFVEQAVLIDAKIHRKLIYSIFVKDSPLHDGAIVINGGRIKAAGCYLPLSHNPDLDPSMGTRHRAALGISERSDAVIIVVSELTGTISIAKEGRFIRNVEADKFREVLGITLQSQKS